MLSKCQTAIPYRSQMPHQSLLETPRKYAKSVFSGTSPRASGGAASNFFHFVLMNPHFPVERKSKPSNPQATDHLRFAASNRLCQRFGGTDGNAFPQTNQRIIERTAVEQITANAFYRRANVKLGVRSAARAMCVFLRQKCRRIASTSRPCGGHFWSCKHRKCFRRRL